MTHVPSMKSRTGLVPFVPGALLCALLLLACRPKEKLIEDGTVFRALSGTQSFQLRSVEQRVTKVVVNFFAPDCPPCEKELPALKQFHRAHAQDPDLLFVSIGSSLRAVGTADASAAPGNAEIDSEIMKFIARFSVDYPQYVAGSAELAAWRVTGFPETFVFMREGSAWKLKRKFISEITPENLEDELK